MSDGQPHPVDEHDHVTELPLWEEYVPSEYLTAAGWISLVVFVLFIVTGAIPQMLYGWPKEPNQLGDTFGITNALFSGFAVAGLIVTILIQIREFRLAQQERRDSLTTQEQISRQHADDVRIQQRISDQQQFASLISSVSTWEQITDHLHRPQYLFNITGEHLDYAVEKYLNSVLLSIAKEYAVLGLELSDHDLVMQRFRSETRYSDKSKLARLYSAFGKTLIERYEQHAAKQVKIARKFPRGTFEEERLRFQWRAARDFRKSMELYLEIELETLGETGTAAVTEGTAQFIEDCTSYLKKIRRPRQIPSGGAVTSASAYVEDCKTDLLDLVCQRLNYFS